MKLKMSSIISRVASTPRLVAVLPTIWKLWWWMILTLATSSRCVRKWLCKSSLLDNASSQLVAWSFLLALFLTCTKMEATQSFAFKWTRSLSASCSITFFYFTMKAIGCGKRKRMALSSIILTLREEQLTWATCAMNGDADQVGINPNYYFELVDSEDSQD